MNKIVLSLGLLLLVSSCGDDNHIVYNPSYEPTNTTPIDPDVTFEINSYSTGNTYCRISGTMINNEDTLILEN